MPDSVVTRRFIRLRLFAALAVILASAAAGAVILVQMRGEIAQRYQVTAQVQEAALAASELASALQALRAAEDVWRSDIPRAELRETTRHLALTADHLQAALIAGGFSAPAEAILRDPLLAPIDLLREMEYMVAPLLPADGPFGAALERVSGDASDLSRLARTILQQVQDAERLALKQSMDAFSLAGWTALLLCALAAVVAFIFMLRPMERRILEMQEAQRRRREEAVSVAEAKSSFLATLGHEIRTPLNGVMGMTELLLDTDLDAPQRDMLGVIRRSGQSLIAMMDDVLTLAKMESRGVELSTEPFNLRDCAGDVAELFRASALAKGLSIALRVDDDIKPMRLGDEGRLRQVLSNLMSNAVKFTEKGEVALELRRGRGEEAVRLIVRDTGVGIPEEALGRIFQSFEQAALDTTRRFGGTGLGLSIVRRIIEAMGGEVAVTSRDGAGSEFTVSLNLPIAPGAQPAAPEAQRPARAYGDRRLHVLAAEDNLINQMVVREMLEPEGCVVEIVENGEAALARCLEFGFDLVLMDLQMPVMGGLEAAQRIRAEEAARGLPRTPIAALTANALPENRDQARAAGMDAFLTKPIDLDMLRQTLERLTDWRPAEAPRRAS